MNKTISVRLVIVAGCFLMSRAHGQAMPSKIDVAATDAEVQALVNSVNEYYKTFTVSSALVFEDKRVSKQYRKAGVKAWAKADFDGNGYTDLIVIGLHHKRSKVLCVLDSGNNQFYVEPFSRQFRRVAAVPEISLVGSMPLLSYYDFGKPDYNDKRLKGRQNFVLTHRFGGFIEYNAKPQIYNIENIEYESYSVYHTSRRIILSVDSLRNATHSFEEYNILDKANKVFEKRQTTINIQDYQQLVGLLNYLNFPVIKESYEMSINHVPHGYLTITYDGGKVKRISDEGQQGTFGLQQVYVLLHKLRRTQSWQLMR
ncbi:hypothetical protein [Hymenobacter lucidus]|uniref:DUF6438 domain-containing protein n=1 Tax=Hymenobacter lucidus TaxID=2880930 RepID=A0ABS8ARK6_9BACT|nr:hypothetical protein [Hymenobacter lucidus]MCB2407971.1 hypothetical protein [Hymenobacter lucidus]